MLRPLLLWASTNPTLAQRLPRVGFVRRATRRFMPGEARSDALEASARLAADGISTAITLLGENLASLEEADEVAAHYRAALQEIEIAGLDTEISVKPTQLGLDFSVDDARTRIAGLCDVGPSLVWIDMEGSAYTDRTLELYRTLREEGRNVGLCMQSYMRRTASDLEALMPLQPAIRLVKGAYREPPEVAFPKKGEVDQNFVRLAQTLLRARSTGTAGRPVFATHDPRMIGEVNRISYELSIAKETYEFGMLYGIASQEQKRLATQGHNVRVQISYGAAWFPWYMRRLAERPANLLFVAQQLVRR